MTASLQLNKTIGVVIPHYKAPDKLHIAIEHLHKQRGVSVDIFVRDNSDDNILFTRAVNEGLRKFISLDSYDYVMVLNQDANLHEECLDQLIQVMDQNSEAGICAPVSLSPDKSVNWAGSAEAYPWGRHVGYNLTQLPKHPYKTPWINGACMLLRIAMLREIGLLDENMRFICSDADISFTARSRGWDCLVVPSAFVEHELGGSASTENAWLNQIKTDDQLYFKRKWISGEVYQSLSIENQNLPLAHVDEPKPVKTELMDASIPANTQVHERLTIICVAFRRYKNIPVLVHSLLAQTLQNFKLIVLHDGYDGEMQKILSEFEGRNPGVIEFLFTEKRFNDWGHTLRDIGIQMAKSEYLLITNDDNYYCPIFVEKMFDAVDELQADLVMCDMIHSHNSPGGRSQPPYSLFQTAPAAYSMDIGCFMVRTEMAKRVGFRDKSHDGDATYFEDLVRNNSDIRIAKVNQVLFFHN